MSLLNAFRITKDGSLDREYMRICAIYRLMKNKKINREQALELAKLPLKFPVGEDGYKTRKLPANMDKTIEIWDREIAKA